MVIRQHRLLGVVLASVAVLVASAVPAAAVDTSRPTPAVTNRWAFVVDRHPHDLIVTPAGVDTGSSAAGTNTIGRVSRGVYAVTLGDMATVGGIVHVSTLGTTPRVCTVQGWNPDPPDEDIGVACFDLNGHTADAMLALTFLDSNSASTQLAYLWADGPTDTDYTPDLSYQHNPTDASNTIHRRGHGDYVVHFPGLTGFPGHNKGVTAVTAYSDVPASCREADRSIAGGAQLVHVLCSRRNGTPLDTSFDVTFMEGTSLIGASGSPAAYLRSDSAGHVATLTGYRYASNGRLPTGKRISKGVYLETLPGERPGGAAIVTAIASAHAGFARCQVASIRTSGHPQKIGVRCYDASGHLQDSAFYLEFVNDSPF